MKKPILIILVHEILKKFDISAYAFAHHTHLKNVAALPYECRTRSPGQSYIVSSSKWIALKIAGYLAT